MRIFLTVAEEKNFSKAANKLFITQQMVSKTIAALEEEIGSPLFVRTTKKVEITAVGRKAYSLFQNVVELSNQCINELREYAQSTDEHISISYFTGLRTWIRTSFKEKLLEVIDREKISWNVNSDLLIIDEEKKEIDCFFTFADKAVIESIKRSGDRVVIVDETKMKIYVSSSHPWAKKGKVEFPELRTESLISMTEPLWTPDGTLYSSYNSSGKGNIYRPNMGSVLDEVEIGKGYTLMPEMDDISQRYDVTGINLPVSEEPIYVVAIISCNSKSTYLDKLNNVLMNVAAKRVNK